MINLNINIVKNPDNVQASIESDAQKINAVKVLESMNIRQNVVPQERPPVYPSAFIK